MDCDRDFGLLERRKKKCKLVTPRDVIHMMTSARVKKPFLVVHMTEFVDWKKIAEENITVSALNITKASRIFMSSEDFGKVTVYQGRSVMQSGTSRNILKAGRTQEDIKTWTSHTPH